MIELKCAKRQPEEKAAGLRKAGKMPAVFYGRKRKAELISATVLDFKKVWQKAGESSVVTLNVDGEEYDSLIHDVDLDPITERPRHADFYVFEKGQKLKVKTPIEFTGVSPAIKDKGGVLVKVMRELEIEAAPKDLPRKIDADISGLVDFGNQILAKDIKLPAGVVLVTEAGEVVALVYEPKEEVVVETAPPDLTAIEVEKKGKEKEGVEGEGASAEPAAKEKAGHEDKAKKTK